LVECECRYFRCKPEFGSGPQKITRVVASHVGYAPDLAFAPEKSVVIELRNPIEMNRVDGNHTAFSQTRKGRNDHIAAGSEGHGAIELYGWLIRLGSHPRGAERTGKLLVRFAACRHVHFAV